MFRLIITTILRESRHNGTFDAKSHRRQLCLVNDALYKMSGLNINIRYQTATEIRLKVHFSCISFDLYFFASKDLNRDSSFRS